MNGEVVFFQLFDVGRYIDLNEIQSIFPGIRDKKIIKTKDTPSYVDFPVPLLLEVTPKINSELKNIKDITLHIKLYSDGVISLIARLIFQDFSFRELHALRRIKYLEGLLHMCVFCKRIRVNGDWFEIERYISENSGAEFSHGLCPECITKYYGEFLGPQKLKIILDNISNETKSEIV